MALPDQIMNGLMAEPEAAVVGLVAGFVIAKLLGMRSGGMGGMGGGF
jgi:hypothetical protein